jgi:serine/threonine protein kinase/beta-lactam-binding protein with PASTA domain
MTSIGDPLVGQLLDSRYQITARLARGGMATVYQAVDTRLTRTVAVKVMHVGLGDDAAFARRFDREARAAARLSHPCVVSVFDQGHDNGRPYIVMEYITGCTLRDVISREAPVTPLRALEVIEPVLSALASAHDAGLVHRDVKPENVLISDRGQIKVADFGLAKAITSQTSTATQGLLIGTVSYLPPELVVSGHADARSDVYSTGVVLFELLTGHKPHTGETPIQVAYAHVHRDVPAPSSFHTAGPIPPYLDALIARATAREPDLRPHDAKVMLTQVRRVRAALRDGLTDDPELTQDLTVMNRDHLDSTSGEPKTDQEDFEATQLVPPRAAPVPQYRSATTAHPTPPTIRDAPPPAVPPRMHELSAARLAGQRQRQLRNRRRGWIALLLVLLLTTVAALAGWFLTAGRFTTAPALTSLTQYEATVVADTVGLDIRFDSAFSESVAKGVVIATDPVAGSKVLDGTQIEAVISKGPERFTMPTVVGLTRAAAESAIVQANLRVRDVKAAYSETVGKDIVLTASPVPGVPLKRQSAVELTVSRGPKPIKIANYTSKTTKDAERALEKLGFVITVESANSATVPAGRVISQTPDEGAGLKGDAITLKNSLGPVMVTVPNVRAMGIRAATKVMTDAGFTVTTKQATNYLGLGFVVYSDPPARTKSPQGSTISLYVV